MSRPKVNVGAGRVTISQAAAMSGLRYHRIRQLLIAGTIRGEQSPSGVWTMPVEEARKIKRVAPNTRSESGVDPKTRKAVMIRVPWSRYSPWKELAGNLPVSTWLAALADREVDRLK